MTGQHVLAAALLLASVFVADLLTPANVSVLYFLALIPAVVSRSRALLWATVALAIIGTVGGSQTVGVLDLGRPIPFEMENRLLSLVALGAAAATAYRFESVLRRKDELRSELAEALQSASNHSKELEFLYRTVPVGLCVLDTGLRFRRINEHLAAMNGATVERHLGRTVHEMVPGLVSEAERLLDQVLTTGEPLLDVEISGETPAQPGQRRHWVESWLPIRTAAGEITGVSIVAEEVTERRASEARKRVLARELEHRVKNVLAVVQVLSSQTFTKRDELETFSQRLAALSRANDLLIANEWKPADLTDAVELGLQVAERDRSRIELSGPPLRVAATSVANIALAVHELTTNAMKYGALSVPSGKVEVTWSLQSGALRWCWRETGGPAVRRPKRVGFGSQLITILAEELNGRAAVEHLPDGLRCTVEATIPAEAQMAAAVE